MTEIQHADSGTALDNLTRRGWQILNNPKGGGHGNYRLTGGWWLFKGEENEARQMQAQQWAKIESDIKKWG